MSPSKSRLQTTQGQTQFEDTFNTSKFGVAKADWEIPQNSQLGDVSITAQVQGDRHSGQEARSQVRTCRYELPIYEVKVHPDRAYYLPGQNARWKSKRTTQLSFQSLRLVGYPSLCFGIPVPIFLAHYFHPGIAGGRTRNRLDPRL
jgi:hypothetical protein